MSGWFKKDGLDRFERDLLRNVEQFGCHINYVGGDAPWAYSVGFTKTIRQDEVVCTGVQLDAAQFFINSVLERCKSTGFVLEDGAVIADVLENCDLVVRRVLPEYLTREWFNSAIWFHDRTFGTQFPGAFQLVWPSAQSGRFPWDPDCDPEFIALQPALFEPSRAA